MKRFIALAFIALIGAREANASKTNVVRLGGQNSDLPFL